MPPSARFFDSDEQHAERGVRAPFLNPPDLPHCISALISTIGRCRVLFGP